MKENKLKVFLILSCIIITPFYLLSCSNSDKENQSKDLKAVYSPGKTMALGNLGKNGWSLDFNKDVFDKKGEISIKVLSNEETSKMLQDGFEIYDSPLEIQYENKDNVRLQNPAILSIKIPEKVMKDVKADQLFFATYYDGKWEVYFPDYVDPEEGVASIKVSHFSFWSLGKLSEEKQIKEFAETLAVLEYQNNLNKSQLAGYIERQYDDLLASIGVDNRSVRKQLTVDMINYLEDANIDSGGLSPVSTLAAMASSLNDGKAGMDDFRNQLIELTGRGLLISLEKDPSYFSNLSGVAGGLSTAAGAILGGDKEGALRGLADILRGTNPFVALADSTLTFIKEEMEHSISIWEQGELEKAYQIYIGKEAGKYGYDMGLEGSLDEIFVVLGGGSRAFEKNVVKKYCEKYGKNEEDLSQEDRSRILAEAKKALEKNFNQRKIDEDAITKLQERQEEFLRVLKEEGLLDSHNYKKFFGLDKNENHYNINDRLRRLYAIKETVLSLMDKKEAENISDEFLVKLMDQWIYWSEKNEREQVLKYMSEMGYIKKPFNEEIEHAWVLVDIIEYSYLPSHPSYSYSGGGSDGAYNGTITFVGVDYEGRGGTFSSQVSFSTPPEIIRKGETVELEVSHSVTANTLTKLYFGSTIHADFDSWDLDIGAATAGRILFYDENNQDYFKILSDSGPQSQNLKLSATLNRSGSPDDKIALRVHYYLSGITLGCGYVYQWREVD